MARLSPVTYNELVQRLRELGFEGPLAEGNILRCEEEIEL